MFFMTLGISQLAFRCSTEYFCLPRAWNLVILGWRGDLGRDVPGFEGVILKPGKAIFKSKGDKLCSSAECRIWIRGPRHQIASSPNARWQTDWAIEDQAKNLNSTAHPYDQRAFSPLGPTVSWLSHLALAIYIFVVVNFDALGQASDIQIERRQVVFLCWMQDLNPGPQTPIRQQTECSLTNRLSYRGSS